MMWRLRIFGLEIASLERDDDEPPPDGITGGSMHNFDRDDRPPNPDDRYDWDIEDRFGFQ
jgi:hypothetical protein